jgi:hypothetical protein
VQEGGVVKAKPMPAGRNSPRSVSVYIISAHVASRELYRSFLGSNKPPLVAGECWSKLDPSCEREMSCNGSYLSSG